MSQIVLSITQQSDIPAQLFAPSYDIVMLSDARANKSSPLELDITLSEGTTRCERLMLMNLTGYIAFNVYQPFGSTLITYLDSTSGPSNSILLIWDIASGLWRYVKWSQR